MYFHYDSKAYNTQSAREVLPLVFSWLHPKNVLDVGCGNGSWLSVVRDLGIEDYLGLDGSHVLQENLQIPMQKFCPQNLQESFDLMQTYDLVISLEVAEHISETYADVFIENLVKHSNTILFSAAIPHQGGFMHFNEQYPTYWIEKFKKYDFECYDIVRQAIWNNENVQIWYRQNTLIFANSLSPIASLFRPVFLGNIVHPNLYEQKALQAQRAEKMEKGELGISIPLKSLKRAFIKKLWKK
jgi:2-polyprenyl-3-methyl-5-hydroxy-6-metoxy-1,4-benzoquinol methylase